MPARPQLTPAEMDARDHDIAVDMVRRRRFPPGVRTVQEQYDAPLTEVELDVVKEIEGILLRQRDPATGELPDTLVVITRSREPMSAEEAADRRKRIVHALAELIAADLRRYPHLTDASVPTVAPAMPPAPKPSRRRKLT